MQITKHVFVETLDKLLSSIFIIASLLLIYVPSHFRRQPTSADGVYCLQ